MAQEPLATLTRSEAVREKVARMLLAVHDGPVHAFPPPVPDQPNPVVIGSVAWEGADDMGDEEFGTAAVEVLVVREEEASAMHDAGELACKMALLDWEPFSTDALRLRGMRVDGAMRRVGPDRSWRHVYAFDVRLDMARCKRCGVVA